MARQGGELRELEVKKISSNQQETRQSCGGE